MNSVQRLARNSLVPMATQALNRLADAAFAVYVLRVLGPEGAGRYEFAIVAWLLVKTIGDAGLGILAAREVAQRPATAGVWLGGGTTVRLLALAGLAPLVGLLLGGYLAVGGLAGETALAVVLLVVSMAPGAVADAATAVLNARERMDLPALVSMLSTALKIVVAGLALALGGGVVGLAAAAVAVNVVTALVLWRLVRPVVSKVEWWPGRAVARHWLVTAWPLVLNNLLVGLFFRLDTFVLQSARGEQELGLYSAAYKFINLTLIVPPYLTMALFPRLARQAEHDPAALRRTLRQALGYLLTLAVPVAIATTLLAEWLIGLLAGAAFLPGAALALRVLIWFLPFSYLNGLLQYGLIALDRQRTITGAFVLTTAFNLGANLLLVPTYGSLGAAAVTVASEVVLLVPLVLVARRALGQLGLPALAWRPLVAGAGMATVAIATAALGAWPATLLGGLTYLGLLLVLGAWGEEERRLARALLARRRPA